MTKKFVADTNLVYDLGMHNGDDTDYYLRKGCRVVAVEANPDLAKLAGERFRSAIEQGRLMLEDVAVWETYATKAFHVCPSFPNLSSLDATWAAREAAPLVEIQVKCVPIEHFFALYGVPGFLKIDIEGADETVLDQLAHLNYLPRYLSIEDCRFGFRYLDKLIAMGYASFKLVDQSRIAGSVDPDIGYAFSSHSSGPMSADAPGAWIPSAEIVAVYTDNIRSRDECRLSPPDVWWDIHCRAPDEHLV